MGKLPLWQVVGFDLVANNHFHDLWSQPPVATDQALEHPFVRQMLDTALPVALPGSVHKGQIPRRAFFQKTRFKRLHDAFRHADEGHGSGSNGISVLDHGSGFCCRNEIRPHCLNPANFQRQWRYPDHRRCTC